MNDTMQLEALLLLQRWTEARDEYARRAVHYETLAFLAREPLKGLFAVGGYAEGARR